MRATLPIFITTSLLALQACVIYDEDCKGCEVDPNDNCPAGEGFCDDADPNGDPSGTNDTAEITDTADSAAEADTVDYGFYLLPSQGEAGEIFIASLRADGEDTPDFEAITDLRFYEGDIEIIASDARSWEYLLTLSISPDAEPGPVDLLVEFKDGTASWVESVFTIYEAGSGHSSGSSDDGSYDPCE